jgi:peptide/nickel transport system permease protein
VRKRPSSGFLARSNELEDAMFAFIVRRLLVSIPVLVLASFIVYALVGLAGDPLARFRTRQPPVSKQFLAQQRHILGLDKPLWWRWSHWLGKVVFHGDFGNDINGNPVGPQLGTRMLVTFRMVTLAIVIAVLVAVVVGVYSAVKQYSVGDYVATFVGFLFLSMPVFWLAALLKEIGAVKINSWLGGRYVYTIGECTPNLKGSCLVHHFGNWAGHVVLPTITLAAITFAGWSRYQRASMLDVLSSDYVRLARAKGLTNVRVMVHHALRTALIPLVTVVALNFTTVVAGAVITENVFSWEGMGRFLVQNGVQQNDVNVVLAWMLVVAVAVVVFNLIADVLYAVLDPRIRYT